VSEEDVYRSFIDTLGPDAEKYFEKKGGGKYMCNLKGINNMLLLSGGRTGPPLQEDNIEISPDCTCCGENYFSHRRQGENRDGTHVSFIGIR
jgi:copper oxidase (laccase) domain-containing protein